MPCKWSRWWQKQYSERKPMAGTKYMQEFYWYNLLNMLLHNAMQSTIENLFIVNLDEARDKKKTGKTRKFYGACFGPCLNFDQSNGSTWLLFWVSFLFQCCRRNFLYLGLKWITNFLIGMDSSRSLPIIHCCPSNLKYSGYSGEMICLLLILILFLVLIWKSIQLLGRCLDKGTSLDFTLRNLRDKDPSAIF